MPDDDLVRTTLWERWRLAATEITALPDAVLSRRWEVTAGADRYVVRLADATARQPVEAGLAAAEHLCRLQLTGGEPLRTLDGCRTAATPGGALAVLRRAPGRVLVGGDPVDQLWWGDQLGAVHRALQCFHHPGLRPWRLLDPGAPHLAAEPWLRPAVAAAVGAAVRLTVTDRLTYGVLHGDPAPGGFVIDAGTGRTGLLDYGCGGIGPLVYDVAAAVVYAGGPGYADDLVDAYLAAGPVDRDELDAALPVLVRLRWAVHAAQAARQGRAESLRAARDALESIPG